MVVSKELDKILPALAKVKSNLGKVTKGANNPFFKSKYADLNTHLEVVEPVLNENGLVLLQPVSTNSDGNNVVESIVFHSESGQYVSSMMTLVGETDMQKAGSAVTYARRYTLGSLLSMQAVDDDGEASLGRKSKPSQAKPASTSKPTAKSSFRKPKKTASKSTPVQTGDDI